MEREQPWSFSSAIRGTVSIAAEFLLDFWRHRAPRQSDHFDCDFNRGCAACIAPPYALALVGAESPVPSVTNVSDRMNIVIVSLVLDIRLYATT
jgi:hypothetical protein